MKMELELNSMRIRLLSSGMFITWMGEEARIAGELMDSFGEFDAPIEGKELTGRFGAFDFRVIGYDVEKDMFHIRRVDPIIRVLK